MAKHGGARVGAGRKPLDKSKKIKHTSIQTHFTTAELLKKIDGKTWDQKVKFLIDYFKRERT